MSQETHRNCALCDESNCTSRCSQCHTTYYCNRSCQVKHWKLAHKKECKKQNQRKRTNQTTKKQKSNIKQSNVEHKTNESDSSDACLTCICGSEYKQSTREECVEAWGDFTNFLISYGLKPYNPDDIPEGIAILDELIKGDRNNWIREHKQCQNK